MTNSSSDNGDLGEGPGLGVEDLKRKGRDDVFETSLSIEQSRRILRATARTDTNFRPIMRSGPKTEGMVEIMRKDRWVWSDADPIRLHLDVPSGEIVCSDGQHRLYAAVKARRTLRTLVLWGDRWRAGVHVDRNRPRNTAQFLQHEHGLGSAPLYVAAARLHLARVLAYTEKLGVNYVRAWVDDETLIAFILDKQQQLHWAINRGSGGGSRGFSMTGYHVFLFELTQIRQEIAEQFHADMLNNDLDSRDPLAQLRRSVMRRYADTGIRSSVPFTIANLVKAHNQRSAGEILTKWITVNSDEVMFPAGFKIDDKRVRSTNR